MDSIADFICSALKWSRRIAATVEVMLGAVSLDTVVKRDSSRALGIVGLKMDAGERNMGLVDTDLERAIKAEAMSSRFNQTPTETET